MNLDHLEQLLETMEPSEIRAKYAEELAQAPGCQALLDQFENLDSQLVSLKNLEDAPAFQAPEPPKRALVWTWALPVAAVLVLGFLFGSGLLKERVNTVEADLEKRVSSQAPSAAPVPAESALEEAEAEADAAPNLDDDLVDAVGSSQVDQAQKKDTKERSSALTEVPAPSTQPILEPQAERVGRIDLGPAEEKPADQEATGVAEEAQPSPEPSRRLKVAAAKPEPKPKKEPKKENRSNLKRTRENRPANLESHVAEAKAKKQETRNLSAEQQRQEAPAKAAASDFYAVAPGTAAEQTNELVLESMEMVVNDQNQAADTASDDAREQPYLAWLDGLRTVAQMGGNWNSLFTQDARITHDAPGTKEVLNPDEFGRLWLNQAIAPDWTLVEIQPQIHNYLALLEVVSAAQPNQLDHWVLRFKLNDKGQCESLKLTGLVPR